MDRNQGQLVEQLQGTQIRQRKAVLQLQADNTRLLSDLIDIRQERDTFREEMAHVRKENAELRNRLEEALTRCQDLRRERATLVRSATTGLADVGGLRIIKPKPRISTTLSTSNECQAESLLVTAEPTTDTIAMVSPKLRPQLYRELPDPLKMTSPRPNRHTSSIIPQ